jgi:DNA-binding response OmpR family regulator
MTRILVIEDDPAILRGLADNLGDEGYDVDAAADGETGYRLLSAHKPDLIVLDLMLPRISGFELCRKLRSEGVHAPILLLTARSEESDRVLGLDLGADDYVTKPFSVRELMARIRALLRRPPPSGAAGSELRFGDVEVDFRRYIVKRKGKTVEMTHKEFDILRFLSSRSGEVVTRDELLNEVWGYESFPVSRTVDNHIVTLRAKLETDPARPRFIKTVRGVGYRFAADERS